MIRQRRGEMNVRDGEVSTSACADGLVDGAGSTAGARGISRAVSLFDGHQRQCQLIETLGMLLTWSQGQPAEVQVTDPQDEEIDEGYKRLVRPR